MTKPVFFRPIEIRNDDNTYYRVTYDVQGGATTNVDVDTGVYSSLPALLYALTDAATDTLPGGVTAAWSLVDSNSALRVRCVTSTAAKITIASNLDQILGDGPNDFDDAYATTHTAAYAPTHTWTPTFQNATQSRWQRSYKQSGNGTIAQTGEVVGNRSGPDIYYRTLRFVNEQASNVFAEAATNLYQPESTLDAFIIGSLWSAPVNAGNVSTRGFFFYPHWSDAIDNPTIVPGGTTGIATTRHGIRYDYSSSENYFTFCQFDINDHPIKSASPHGIQYYDTGEFEIHTIDAMPIWQAPAQP